MRKTFLVAFALLLLGCQKEVKISYIEYNRNISESKYLLLKGDTLNAIKLIEENIERVKRPFIRDYRTLIELKLKQNKDITKTAKEAFKLGASKEYLCSREEIKNRIQDKWNKLFPNYHEIRKQYLDNIDTAYRKQIKNLYLEDQKYRSLAPQNSDLNIDSLRAENDQLVLNQLRKLIQTKGFYGFSTIGEDLIPKGFTMQELFFRHVDPQVNKKEFYKLLREAFLNGEIYPESYAGIMDHDCIKQDQFAQIYGTCFFNYKGLYCFPLKEKGKIDSLRTSLGMLPFQKHLECSNAKYDEKIKPWLF
jgi:hypothetical protein